MRRVLDLYIAVLLVACVTFLLTVFTPGCALLNPAVEFTWGTAHYAAYGDHVMDELEVTKEILKDGREIIHIKVKKSESREVQAIQKALDIAGEAIKRIPAAP